MNWQKIHYIYTKSQLFNSELGKGLADTMEREWVESEYKVEGIIGR